jgi:PKD repeat protein
LRQVEQLVNKEKYGAPEAAFTVSRTSGCEPLTVTFTDQSSGDAARPVTEWNWDFGDSTTSTDQNPSHTFTQQGRYTVSLTVSGPTGSDTETKTNYITLAIFDVNGDGYSDYIIGEPNSGTHYDGQAIVYSGYNGSVIWTKSAENSENYFGGSVNDAGDINKDGYADFIIGAEGYPTGFAYQGKVYVYSGATGNELYSKTGEASFQNFGDSVAGAGDVNGDGYPDFVVGAPGYPDYTSGSKNGKFYIYSGSNGDLLYSAQGGGTDDARGASVARVGDIDGDGRDEIIVGAPGAYSGQGRAYIYRYNGSVYYIYRYVNPPDTYNDRFGTVVSGCGDVNNDGYPDYIVGDPYYGNTSFYGAAYVFSGYNGSLLYSKYGVFGGDNCGIAVAGADLNQDGHSDFIVGNSYYDGGDYQGRIDIYSGVNGGILHSSKYGTADGDRFGAAVGAGGDINRDGYPDYIVGARGFANPQSWDGKVYVYSGLNGSELTAKTGTTEDSFGASVSNGPTGN